MRLENISLADARQKIHDAERKISGALLELTKTTGLNIDTVEITPAKSQEISNTGKIVAYTVNIFAKV